MPIGSEWPSCTICSTRPAGTASTATIEMSMPRPMTTIAMPRPRMPRMATFCSRPSMLRRGAKAGQEQREAGEHQHEDREHDLLLAERAFAER